MSTNSNIAWTNHTWNPWVGCSKVDAGCRNCYMFRDMARWGQDPTTVRRTSTQTFNGPLHISKPALIFTCSWSDFFHEAADPWRDAAWDVIRACPQHTFQILTKRPERILAHLPEDWGAGWDNVWIGTSVSGQEDPWSISYADHKEIERVGDLIAVPAKTRFLSIEPMLGPYANSIMITNFADATKIHWVIVGGESGSKKGKGLHQARKCEPAWLQATVDFCKAAGIPVFVKQLGSHFGRQHANIDVFPVGLRVQEWPVKVTASEQPAASGKETAGATAEKS